MKMQTKQLLGLGVLVASLIGADAAQAASLTLDFSSGGGTILDTNGVGTGFTTRLSGTGGSLLSSDANLLLDTSAGTLSIKSTTADFNGQNGLGVLEAIGIQLSSLGFTGPQDFVITATFTNVPDNTILTSFDQIGLFVGRDSATLTRGTLVNYDFFGNDNEGVGIDVQNGSDTGGNYGGSNPGTNMVIQVSRTDGTWLVRINGNDKTPAQPAFLNGDSDLTVGVCVFDTGGAHPTPDNKFVAMLDSFTATVIIVAGATAPVITNQPQKQIVNEGNPATFSVLVTTNSAQPRFYQWRKDGTPVAAATNRVFTLFPGRAEAGNYTVVITNSIGSVTSSVAPLSVVLPSGEFSLDFNSATGGILDINGAGIGFPTRLPGTGAALLTNDENLLLDTNNGVLDITTTSSDFNGAGGMDVNESLGVSLASLGFTGSQDLNASALFQLPFPATAMYDQFGIVVGVDTNAHTRAGTITFAGKERYSENVQTNTSGAPVNGGGQYFGFGFDPGIPMTVLISRTAGAWHYYIDEVQWDVLTQPTFLNSATNLIACAFAEDVGNGVHKTVALDSFGARVFSGIKLNVARTGANLTFTWNVAGPSGLQSNTNLLNPAGWTAVAGATNSPFATPISTGQRFFRAVQ